MIERFSNVDYWKAIILYGLNQATYKIALGKTLLELAEKNKSEIDWHLLSKVYFDNYLQRLKVLLDHNKVTHLEKLLWSE